MSPDREDEFELPNGLRRAVGRFALFVVARKDAKRQLMADKPDAAVVNSRITALEGLALSSSRNRAARTTGRSRSFAPRRIIGARSCFRPPLRHV